MPKNKAVKGDGAARDVGNCTCSRLRRAGRRVTQLYDQWLEPAGVTIGQFGLLAHLQGQDGVAIGALADARGMDPTTLTRNLKPLVEHGWVMDGRDARDRRVRTVAITASGREKVRAARPLWERADAQLEAELGASTVAALNALLEVSLDRVGPVRRPGNIRA
jgi:DNA-binding MarR family transcriptional regulator